MEQQKEIFKSAYLRSRNRFKHCIFHRQIDGGINGTLCRTATNNKKNQKFQIGVFAAEKSQKIS